MLSACGVPTEGVDIRETEPNGIWQEFFVWPLAKGLLWIDDYFVDFGVPHHWGYAIIAFTFLIKLITLPLTFAQIRGMEAQKKIQPKLQELQKKYGKDREKMAQEQMKLYQEAGVNPLSGCLPLIVQMPILFGLYSALVALGTTLENSTFYWIPDLGFPKYTQGLSWLSQSFQAGDYVTLASYLILPILLVTSQFFMQKWMTPAPPPNPDNKNDPASMTRQMGLMMTFMFGFFTLQVPAALTLYWVTSNFLQMLQQWLISSNLSLAGAAAGAGSATPSLVAETNTGSAAISGSYENVATSSTNGTQKAAGANKTNNNKSQSNKKKKRKKRR